MKWVNRILNAVSEDAQRRIQPHLERVRLSPAKVIYRPGETMRHAWFPEYAVLSLLALTVDGGAAEIAMVGFDGVVGLPIVLPVNTAPYQVVVQIGGDVWRLRADILRAEFRRDESVQESMLEHLHDLMAQMAQSNVCNRYHSVLQRLCRWLLMMQDRSRSDTIPLTQEFLGHMLGATRNRVSHAAAQLQDASCIRQRHGQIKIVDRRGIEQRACECYRLVKPRVMAPASTDQRIAPSFASGSRGR